MKALATFGCGRSGTTLLNFLCRTGFEGIYLPDRSHKKKLLDEKELKKVEKAGYACYLTGTVKRARQMIASPLYNPVYLVMITRDPRGVLLSKQTAAVEEGYTPFYHTRPHKWLGTNTVVINMKRQYPATSMIVKFEELLEKPNEIQKDISARTGLKIKTLFSECWKDFEVDRDNKIRLNKPRPLDPSRAYPWKNCTPTEESYLTGCFRAFPKMIVYMDALGYDYSDIIAKPSIEMLEYFKNKNEINPRDKTIAKIRNEIEKNYKEEEWTLIMN